MSEALPYRGCTVLLTSKHHKEQAIAPPFAQHLGARVQSCPLDTDSLGTFSGEVERSGDALHCARRKCLWGLESSAAEFGLASEGSFGPHPLVPFVAVGQELLLFMDRNCGFELHLAMSSEQTNYRGVALGSWAEAQRFAEQARFPSHALIVRPDGPLEPASMTKGITSPAELEQAFTRALAHSGSGKVWLETDMRAHLNPTRMTVIGQLAEQLALRLGCLCPACNSPGWGPTGVERGLPCGWCGTATELAKAERYGCAACDHEQLQPRADGLREADPGRCPVCNP